MVIAPASSSVRPTRTTTTSNSAPLPPCNDYDIDLLPREYRLRTSSESILDARDLVPVLADVLRHELLLQRTQVQRSASCSEVYQQHLHRRRHAHDELYRVRIRCRDEALCVRSQENVLRLVETIQKSPSDSTSTSVILAKKALKYRRLLKQAEQVDLNDPAFDVGQFLRERRGRTELVGYRRGTAVP